MKTRIEGKTITSGKCVITKFNGDISLGGGASNLSQSEFDAYKDAKLLVSKGSIDSAVAILEEEGFTVIVN